MGLLASILSGVNSISSLINGISSNVTNKQIAQENLKYQREANAQNIALTREINNSNLAFQAQENEITRQREDNAVQRAAADMQAAGLSKTLAAGSPASSTALSPATLQTPQVEALHNDFKHTNLDLDLLNTISTVANVNNINAQTEKTKAEARYIDLEKRSEAELKESQTKLNKANTEAQEIYNKHADDIYTTQIAKGVSDVHLSESNIDYVRKNTDLLAEKIVSEQLGQENLSAQTKKLNIDYTKAKLDAMVIKYDLTLSMAQGQYYGGAQSGVGKIASDFTGALQKTFNFDGVNALSDALSGITF